MQRKEKRRASTPFFVRGQLIDGSSEIHPLVRIIQKFCFARTPTDTNSAKYNLLYQKISIPIIPRSSVKQVISRLFSGEPNFSALEPVAHFFSFNPTLLVEIITHADPGKPLNETALMVVYINILSWLSMQDISPIIQYATDLVQAVMLLNEHVDSDIYIYVLEHIIEQFLAQTDIPFPFSLVSHSESLLLRILICS